MASSRVWFQLSFCILAIVQLLAPRQAAADAFDWRYVGGSKFVTGIRDQGGAGTCAAFGSTAALEAKYLITRNDTAWGLNLSEQNVVCAYGAIPISETWAMDYFTSTGIVAETELRYTESVTSPNWPLQPGWENRLVKSTANANSRPSDPASVMSDLKAYGPLCAVVYSTDLDEEGRGSSTNSDHLHAVLIVGCYDNSSYAGGGYVVVKNSWGTGYKEIPSENFPYFKIDFNYEGYSRVAYANLQRLDRVHAITGQAYYTGSMGTLTWALPASGTWSTGAASWTMDGSAKSWLNGEYSAVFDSPAAGGATVTLADVSAHQLDIHGGATGYTLTGGKLLVTGGGINAQEDCTINSPVALGMTQTWTAGAGKTLTVGGPVKMHINSLTIGGDGNTTLNGAVSDVSSDPQFTGLLTGYKPSLTKTGNGTLTLAGNNTYTGPTTVSAGTLDIAAAGSVANTNRVNVVNSSILTISGSLAVADNGVFAVGCGNGTTGTVVVHNGAVLNVGAGSDGTVGGTYIGGKIDNSGSDGTGTLTIEGGAVNVAAGGSRPGGDGTHLWLNAWGGSGSTIYLNGGTLSTARPIANGRPAPAVATVNLNGGTLRPALDGINILEGGLTVNVRDNGAIVDTNGFDTTITAPLLHSTINGDHAVDGGLTKKGDGVLALTGNNTYSGGTTVNAGILRAKTKAALPGRDTPDKVTVAGGATLALNAGGTGEWNDAADVDSLLAANGGGFAPGALLGIDTTNAVGGQFACPGALGGFQGLRKLGDGTLRMAFANTYTGGTVVSAGTLQTTTTAALPDYDTPYKISVANGATLAVSAGGPGEWNDTAIGSLLAANGGGFFGLLGIDTTNAPSGQFAYAGAISGPLALKKLGPGTLTLSGANTYTGGTMVSSGTLQGSAGSIQGNVNLAAANANLTFDQTDTDGIYGGITSGSGGLTKIGAKTLAVFGNNTYTGTTTISEGTLKVGYAYTPTTDGLELWLDAASAGTLAVNADGTGGTPAPGGAVGRWTSRVGGTYASIASGGPTYQTNVQAGQPVLRFSGSNPLALTNPLTADGTTVFIMFRTDSGSYTQPVNSSGTSLHQTDGANPGRRCAVTSGGAMRIQGANFPKASEWHVQEVQVKAGNWALWVDNNLLGTNANATAIGPLTDVGGTMPGDIGEVLIYDGQLSEQVRTDIYNFLAAKWVGQQAFDAIPDVSPVTIAAGATLDLTGYRETVGPLSGAGRVLLDNGTLTVNSIHDSEFSGVISGAGALTKTGAGAFTLSGANTYTGPTLVQIGTLDIGPSGSLSSAGNVNAVGAGGATLSISGTMTMAEGKAFGVGSGMTGATGTVTVNSGGALTIGGGNGYTAIGGDYVNAAGTGRNGQFGAGTLAINSGGVVNVGAPGTAGNGPGGTDTTHLWLNPYGGSGSAIHLNGGTLSTARPIANGNSGGIATVNFDGGTLQAAAGMDIFNDPRALKMNVRDGEAIIDTNGFDVTVSRALLHSAIGGDAEIDGGLKKTGAGKLALTTINTYSGPTTITAGTLETSGNGTLGAGLASNNIFVESGATLEFSRNNTFGSATMTDPPPLTITLNGGTMTSNNTCTTLGPVILNGGAIVDAGGLNASYRAFTLRGTISVLANASSSTISAAGGNYSGIHLRTPTTIDVADGPAADDLVISAALLNKDAASPGAASLVKTGDGTMVLSGVNTYTGETGISAGTLRAATTAALPGYGTSGKINVASGAMLALSAGGPGEWNTTTDDIGSLLAANSGGFAAGASLGIDTSNAPGGWFAHAGTISGPQCLKKLGAGTLALSGAETYSGATEVRQGTLQLQRPPETLPISAGLTARFDAATLTGDDGSLVSTWEDSSPAGHHATRSTASTPGYPQLKLGAQNGLNAVRFAENGGSWFSFPNMTDIRSVFWVAKESTAGEHFLLGDNDKYHFHRAEVMGGEVALWHPAYAHANIRNGATRLMGAEVNGTTTPLGSGFKLIDVVTAGNVEASRISSDRTIAGRSWDGEIGEILIYNQPLTALQVEEVEAYLLYKWFGIGGSDILPTTTAVNITAAGAALDLNNVDQTIGSLSGAAGSLVKLGTGALTVGDSTSTAFAGDISGSGVLVKAGPGKLTLSGANVYTGGTRVSEGTLEIGGAGSLPAGGGLTIDAGGTLVLVGGLSAGAAGGAAQSAAAVPEPETMVLLAAAVLAGLALCLQHRRRTGK